MKNERATKDEPGKNTNNKRKNGRQNEPHKHEEQKERTDTTKRDIKTDVANERTTQRSIIVERTNGIMT